MDSAFRVRGFADFKILGFVVQEPRVTWFACNSEGFGVRVGSACVWAKASNCFGSPLAKVLFLPAWSRGRVGLVHIGRLLIDPSLELDVN